MKSLAIKAVKRIEKEALEQQVLLNKLYHVKTSKASKAQLNLKKSIVVAPKAGINYDAYLQDLLGLKKK
jgi:hypothetical protein